MAIGGQMNRAEGTSGPRLTPEQAMFRRVLGPLLMGSLTQSQQPSIFQTQLPTQFLGLLDPSLASNLRTGQGALSGSVTPLSGSGRAAADRNALQGQVDAFGAPTTTQQGQAAFQQEQFVNFLNSLL